MQILLILYIVALIALTCDLVLVYLLYRKIGYRTYRTLLFLVTGALMITASELYRILFFTYRPMPGTILLIKTAVTIGGETMILLFLPSVVHERAQSHRKTPVRPERAALAGLLVFLVQAAAVAAGTVEPPHSPLLPAATCCFIFCIYRYRKNLCSTDMMFRIYTLGAIVLTPVLAALTVLSWFYGYLVIYTAPVVAFFLVAAVMRIVATGKTHFSAHPAEWIPAEFLAAFHISPREQDVIRLLLEGCTSAVIGRLLCISERTVRNHIYSIYLKTGVNNRVEFINLVRNASDLVSRRS